MVWAQAELPSDACTAHYICAPAKPPSTSTAITWGFHFIYWPLSMHYLSTLWGFHQPTIQFNNDSLQPALHFLGQLKHQGVNEAQCCTSTAIILRFLIFERS